MKKTWDKFIETLNANKKLLLYCLAFTFIWGIVTHGYMYFNNAISHDSLNEYILKEHALNIKLNAGRIMVPLYDFLIRGIIATPSLIGILTLVYLSFTLFVLVKIFFIKSKVLLVFVAGILTANVAMIKLNAMFIHDADVDMLGVMLTVISIYIWDKNKNKKFKYIFSCIPLFFGIGLYQACLALAFTLVLFILIFDALRGEKCKKIFIQALKALLMIFIACIIYYVIMKIVLAITGVVQEGQWNLLASLSNLFPTKIFSSVAYAYYHCCLYIIKPISIFSTPATLIINCGFLLIVGTLLLFKIFRKGLNVRNKFLIIGMIAILPLAINFFGVILNNTSHVVRIYPLYFVYLFGLLLVQEYLGNCNQADESNKNECATQNNEREMRKCKKFTFKNSLIFIQPICYLLIAVILFGNVRYANTLYTLKDHQKDATLSLMTRVLSEIENCDGYIVGETQIVFVGTLDEQFMQDSAYEKMREMYSQYSSIGLKYSDFYQSYFNYVMKIKMVVASNDAREIYEQDERVIAMPVYPNKGGVQMIDNVIVVKWSSIE